MRRFLPAVLVPIVFLGTTSLNAQAQKAASKSTVTASGATSSSSAATTRSDLVSAPAPRPSGAYGDLPMSFEENRGQTDSRVNYLARGKGYTLFLTPNETVLALRHALPTENEKPGANSIVMSPANAPRWSQEVVRFRLAGGSANPKIEALEKLPGISNYYIGNDPSKWHTGIPNFRKVIYRDAYPGVDLTYYGNPGLLESDFVVAPGADPGVIAWNVDGVKRMRVDASGDLILETADASMSLQKPVVYQMVAGVRREVTGAYFVDGKKVRFAIGPYDRSQSLVIDPILFYSTYLGGSNGSIGDVANGVAVDKAGEAFVAGIASSTDFPTTSAFQDTLGSGAFANAFVTKFAANGSSLVFSTYLGGGSNDAANGIAADAAGNSFVVGRTTSSNFPLHLPLQGQAQFTGNQCGFVSTFSPAGALTFSTLLCGGAQDQANQVGIDTSENIYVVGSTTSAGFPTVAPVQASLAGNQNAFVTKLAAITGNGSSLLFSTFFGGNNFDEGNALAVDGLGNIYFAGATNSSVFPTKNALQANLNAKNGGFNAFAAEISTSTPVFSTVYSTYFGGSVSDVAHGIAIDGNANAYIAGSATSQDFPLKNSLQAPDPNGDAFVAEIGPNGAPLVFSTLFGGSISTTAEAIALDNEGNIYIAGQTSSGDLPTFDPLQATLNNQFAFNTGFVTGFKPNVSGFLISTYFGGSFAVSEVQDGVNAIATDTSGNLYVAGQTSTADFPTVSPFQPTLKDPANSNAFLAKMIAGQQEGPQMFPTALNFGTVSTTTTSRSQTVSLVAGLSPVTITSIVVSGPNAADFSTFSTCGPTVPSTVVCTFTETFTPSISGTESATVTVNEGTTAGNGTQVFTLTGTGSGSPPPIGTITFTPNSLTFGSQEVGTIDPNAQGVSITVTGTTPVTLQSTGSTGTNPSDFGQGGQITATLCNFGVALAPGTTCSVPFEFSPQGVGARSATVQIFGTFANSPASVNVTGTGTPQIASLTPTSLTFPNTVINTSSTAMIATLKNVSTTVTLTNIVPTVTPPFSISANVCPVTGGLAPGASCTISIIFSPTTANSFGGELTVTDSDPVPQSVFVSGQGLNPTATLATIFQSSISFGRQTIGSTSSAHFVFLQNTGNTNLVFTNPVSGTNASTFAATNTCGGTIAPGMECFLSITFAPTATGPSFATVTVQSTATGAPQSVALSGTGVQPTTVSLLPDPLIFPATGVGQTSAVEFAFLNNTGPNLDTINNIGISGADPGDFELTFTGPGNTPCFVGATLNAQAVCVIGVAFVPTQTGQRTATLQVTDTATGTTHTINLQGGMGTAPPALSIMKSHMGNFTQGQQGATYTVTVANAAAAGPTSGLVTVTENAPSGLTLVSMAGTGWTCSANTCTTMTVLQPGTSYPTITVTVNVLANATSPQVNAINVFGGGSATNSTTDSTVINASGVQLTVATAGTGTGTVTGNGIACSSGSATGCTVNLAAGTQVSLIAGTLNGSTFAGWSAPCNGSTATTCAFAMPATPLTVTATFTAGATTAALTVVTAGTGTGTVTGAGITCMSGSSAGCTTTVTAGNQVTLTEMPNAGSGFGGWSSICPSSTSATCTFTMPPTATMVTATFTLNPATLKSIAVTPTNPTEPITSTLQFTATGTFSDSSTKDITSTVAWASSNPDAATINEEGGLATTGPTAGLTTTISATQSEVQGSTLLTVSNSPITITVTPPPGGSFPPVPPGGRLAVGVVITAIPGFMGTVNFGCSTSSVTITCRPDPASVVFTSSGPTQVAFVVDTFCKGPTATSVPGPNGFGLGGGLGLALLAFALGGLTWIYRKSPRWALSFAVLLLFALGGIACSSPPAGPNGATPPGNYTVTITATVNGNTTSTPPVPFTVD